jgi:hypothetical protein
MADLEQALRRLHEDPDLLDEFLANAEDVAARLDLSDADRGALVSGEIPLPNDSEAAGRLKSAVLQTFGDKCPQRSVTL